MMHREGLTLTVWRPSLCLKHHILTYKDDPRTERIKMAVERITMAVDP